MSTPRKRELQQDDCPTEPLVEQYGQRHAKALADTWVAFEEGEAVAEWTVEKGKFPLTAKLVGEDATFIIDVDLGCLNLVHKLDGAQEGAEEAYVCVQREECRMYWRRRARGRLGPPILWKRLVACSSREVAEARATPEKTERPTKVRKVNTPAAKGDDAVTPRLVTGDKAMQISTKKHVKIATFVDGA